MLYPKISSAFKCLMLISLFCYAPLFALSLEEAVFRALENNPEIKAKQSSFESVKSEGDLVRSAYFPKVNVSTGIGRAKDLIIPAYRESGARVTRTDSSVSATLNLFSGFHTWHDVASQRHRSDAAASYVQESKSALAMMTIERYITMIKQKLLLQISRENVNSLRDIYEKLKEKEASGMAKASDVGFASGRLTLAEVNAVINENNFIQSKLLLETVLGDKTEAIDLKEPRFDYLLPESMEAAAAQALEDNPSVRLGRHTIKSTQSNYKRSRSVYYPSLDFEIKRAIFDEKGPFDYSVDSSYAMLYLNYNLYNGSADKAMVEKEFFTLQQSKQELQSTRREVTKKLGTAWISALQMEKQLRLLEKMRLLNRQTMEDYYREFGIGKRTLLDIINVKNDYNNARQSYATVRYDLLLAKFRILEAMGGVLGYISKKAEGMSITMDEDRNEEGSLDAIIKEMGHKLHKGESFLPFEGNPSADEGIDFDK